MNLLWYCVLYIRFFQFLNFYHVFFGILTLNVFFFNVLLISDAKQIMYFIILQSEILVIIWLETTKYWILGYYHT